MNTEPKLDGTPANHPINPKPGLMGTPANHPINPKTGIDGDPGKGRRKITKSQKEVHEVH
jgi:hypothetical protein